MGLLDDAIREHLELKRRRGADPDEVARQEDEALGDPRSGEFAPAEAEAMEEPPPESAAVEEELQPEPEVAPGAEPETASEIDQDAWFDDDESADTEDGRGPDDYAPREPESEVVQPDDEPAAEDVLGETPEFLQETPEHDRLWFEQKPPRDFDFDG
jgi:hypothetical protein